MIVSLNLANFMIRTCFYFNFLITWRGSRLGTKEIFAKGIDREKSIVGERKASKHGKKVDLFHGEFTVLSSNTRNPDRNSSRNFILLSHSITFNENFILKSSHFWLRISKSIGEKKNLLRGQRRNYFLLPLLNDLI